MPRDQLSHEVPGEAGRARAPDPATYPPALLLEPTYELVQELATHGVPVILARDRAGGAITVSRYVTAVERCPPIWSAAFEAWFEEMLARYPDAVVMPGSDDATWWLAERSEHWPNERAHFAVAPVAAVRTVLAKWALYEACCEWEVRAPETALAPSLEAARALRVAYPAVVKPQTRVGRLHWGQGQFVGNREELEDAIAWALANVHFRADTLGSMPGLEVPIVQEFIGGRDRSIYHLCGYLSATGQAAVLAHRKLLQVPRRFGSGVCFETAAVDESLAGLLVRMLRGVGYHGIFEAEFVQRDEASLLIDVNPRVYNGAGLEAARGLSLGWCAYLESLGEDELLATELAKAARLPERPELAWCRKLEFAALLIGQTVSGGFSPRQSLGWVRWYWRRRRHLIDPWVVRGDLRPGRRHLREQLLTWLRRPRLFLGAYVRREARR